MQLKQVGKGGVPIILWPNSSVPRYTQSIAVGSLLVSPALALQQAWIEQGKKIAQLFCNKKMEHFFPRYPKAYSSSKKNLHPFIREKRFTQDSSSLIAFRKNLLCLMNGQKVFDRTGCCCNISRKCTTTDFFNFERSFFSSLPPSFCAVPLFGESLFIVLSQLLEESKKWDILGRLL